jgi:hypothetical protein
MSDSARRIPFALSNERPPSLYSETLPVSVKYASTVIAVCYFGARVFWSSPVMGETDECGDPSRSWIVVDFGVEPLRGLVVSDVTTQLRAGLSKRGIDVCTDEARASGPGEALAPPRRTAPMATLVFSPVDKDGVAISLEVHDAITEKRVRREIDLRMTPPDGRALVLAVEADELLRATWAELAMKDASPTRTEVPLSVRRAVASSIPGAPGLLVALSRGAIGLRATVERFTGGLTFFGGDVRSEYWFAPRWGAAVSIGYRAASAVDSSLGEVSTDALHGGFGGVFAITPRDRNFGFDLATSLDAFVVYFNPRAASGAVATRSSDGAVTATAALAGWVVIASPLRVGWEAGVALPVRAVEATSDAESLESTRGVGLIGAVDIAFCF